MADHRHPPDQRPAHPGARPSRHHPPRRRPTMSTLVAPGVSLLEPHECWQLLRSTEVGRLAVAVMNQPDIFPVNYVVDHGSVVFRTAEGTKLAAATLGQGVAFEVDGYEPGNGEAWSVVLKGRAVEIA